MHHLGAGLRSSRFAGDGDHVQGDTLGRYRLLERIGIGGMAEVFVAKAMSGAGVAGFSRAVVVKRLLPQLVSDVDAVGMFLDEARLGAKLVHPHIVGVVDLGEADGEAFMVLDYVDGADAGVLLNRARQRGVQIPVEHAALIVARAALGLHHAHTAIDKETGQVLGVIHRDVSPSNILVSKGGDVKVADFGVARSALQSVRTGTGAIKGKISYMSPEQLTGDVLDARSDVYALGIVLWELLAQGRLYDGKNEAQIIQAVQRDLPPPPSTKNQAVPPILDDLVLRCLARDVAKRPASAGEVAHVLESFLHTRPKGTAVAFEQWLLGEGAVLFEPDAPGLSALLMAGQRRTPVSAAKPMPSMGSLSSSSSSPSSDLTPALKRVKAPGAGTPPQGLKLASKAPERKRELVLYVEDEPENRDVAELRLRRSYDLLLAATDQEACEIVKTRGHELAAILMDIQLKGSVLDGIALVKLIRGTLPTAGLLAFARDVPVLASTPILFVTAYGARYSEPELLAAGAQKLVTKPVNFSDLTLALVDLHLRRATRT